MRVVQANSRGYPRRWDHTEYSDRPEIQDFLYDRDLRLREIRYSRYGGEDVDPRLEKRIELCNEGETTNGLVKHFADESQLALSFASVNLTSLDDPTKTFGSSKSDITQHLLLRDLNGRVVQRLFLNPYGVNVADGDGICGFKYEHDGMGRMTAQRYLFLIGERFECRANKKGIVGKAYQYKNRVMNKVEYVDLQGRPSIGPRGWKICEGRFDEYDNNIESSFLDESGHRVLESNGIAGCKTTYDGRGDMIARTYTGTNGMPVLHKEGFSELRWEYDERGRQTKVSCFGVDGKPALHKNGYAQMRWAYDKCGNKTKESYFGTDGHATLFKDGFAKVCVEYDKYGHMTQQTFFGIDGGPALHRYGYAKVCLKYAYASQEWVCRNTVEI